MAVFLHKNAFVTPPEQLTIDIPAAVITLGINTVDMAHYSGKVAGGCLHEKMIMVRHKAICRNPEIKHLGGLLQQSNERLIVFVIPKDVVSPPPAVHYMIPGIGVFYSKWSGHGVQVKSFDKKGQAKT
jgi:hypothetical protein